MEAFTFIHVCIDSIHVHVYMYGWLLSLLCREFQQEYQTYFRHSFRVCDYLSKEDAGLRDLLNACQGIKVGFSLSLSLSLSLSPSLSPSTECSPVHAHIHVKYRVGYECDAC